MRDIEFRGKRKDGGGWTHGDFLRAEYQGKTCCWIVARGGENKSHDVEPDTVGQYTGQTDKNGVRIFEGDIVRIASAPINGREFEGYSAVVGFTGSAFGLERVNVYCHRNEHWLEHGFCEPFWPFGHCAYLVIGNVHDSPELPRDEADNARARPP